MAADFGPSSLENRSTATSVEQRALPGRLRRWDAASNWGFIFSDLHQRDIYVEGENIQGPLQEGDLVLFQQSIDEDEQLTACAVRRVETTDIVHQQELLAESYKQHFHLQPQVPDVVRSFSSGGGQGSHRSERRPRAREQAVGSQWRPEPLQQLPPPPPAYPAPCEPSGFSMSGTVVHQVHMTNPGSTSASSANAMAKPSAASNARFEPPLVFTENVETLINLIRGGLSYEQQRQLRERVSKRRPEHIAIEVADEWVKIATQPPASIIMSEAAAAVDHHGHGAASFSASLQVLSPAAAPTTAWEASWPWSNNNTGHHLYHRDAAGQFLGGGGPDTSAFAATTAL